MARLSAARMASGNTLAFDAGARFAPVGAESERLRSQLPRVEVVNGLGADVRIDGTAVARGGSLTVKYGPHRVEIVVGGTVTRTERIAVPGVARCTLRDQPALDCYP